MGSYACCHSRRFIALSIPRSSSTTKTSLRNWAGQCWWLAAGAQARDLRRNVRSRTDSTNVESYLKSMAGPPPARKNVPAIATPAMLGPLL